MSTELALDTPTVGTICLEQNFAVTEDGYEFLNKTPTELFVVH
ncbi:MAG: hypothetical protein PUD38_01135 [Firmicutes bacterium]|nr:hypothetical protein [Bacillota bacterium]